MGAGEALSLPSNHVCVAAWWFSPCVPEAAASPGNLSHMRMLELRPRLTASETRSLPGGSETAQV